MMKFIIGSILALMFSAASAQDTRLLTGDYGRGFCDAVKAMMQNRDHYRALVGFPAETHEESMKRIYEKWPPRPPQGFQEKTIIDQQLNLEMAGIDLYVVLPPELCANLTK